MGVLAVWRRRYPISAAMCWRNRTSVNAAAGRLALFRKAGGECREGLEKHSADARQGYG